MKAAVLLLLSVSATCALDWDTDQVTPGAQGAATSPATWDMVNARWWNGSAQTVWAANSDATFGGTVGHVQLGANLTANDLTFNAGTFTTPGAPPFAGTYQILGSVTAGQLLTLVAEGLVMPKLTVAADKKAIIATTVANTGLGGTSGFHKEGAGRLLLQQNSTTASSPLSGVITVNAGMLLFDSTVATSLSGADPFPNLTAITVNSGGELQLDRSHVLAGASGLSYPTITINAGGSFWMSNARQYLSQVNLHQAGISSGGRETTSAGTDEGDFAALLTPGGGLTITTTAGPLGSVIFPNIEIHQGPLTCNVADGGAAQDLIISGGILAPGASTQSVTKSGAGTLRLNTAGTFRGDFLATGGLTTLQGPDALGEATAGGHGEVRVSAGAGVNLGGQVNTKNKAWFIAGDGSAGDGAVVNEGTANIQDGSRIMHLTLTANASVGGGGGIWNLAWNPTNNTPGSINGGGFTLTKRGSGEVRVRAASTNITWAMAPNGGTLTGTITNAFGTDDINLSGNSTLNGSGTVTFPNPVTIPGSATLAAEGGTTTWGGVIRLAELDMTVQTPAGGTAVFNDRIRSGGGRVLKTGAGAVSFNSEAPRVIATAGTVGGTGTLASQCDIAAAATLAPGQPTGTLTINSALILAGKLLWHVNGANAGRVNIASTLSIAPTATIELAAGNTYTQPAYILATYGNLDGTFSTLPRPPDGYVWAFNYLGQNQLALVLDPYAAWTAARGLTGANALPSTDPDRDRAPNGIEFVIGGEPNPANPGAHSAALLPTVTVNATHVVFTFRRTAESAYLNPVARYGSHPAGPWTTAVHGTAGVDIVVTPNGFSAGVDRVQVGIPRSGATMFCRLYVSVP